MRANGMRRFMVAGFDADGALRAFGFGPTILGATNEAARQSSLYIQERRKLGEHTTLQLFQVYKNGRPYHAYLGVTTMKHPYKPDCPCTRCTRERARRNAQSRSDPLAAIVKRARRTRSKGSRSPIVGSAEWAEMRGDDIDSPSGDY